MLGQDPERVLNELKAARRLPSPPGIALRILELCRSDDSELHEITDLIMSDPALAARMLRFANSALVGVRHEVTSVLEAVLLLGLRATRLTALGFSLPLREFQPTCHRFDLRAFWSESFLLAVLARGPVSLRLKVDREDAFTAGLLSGIGRLVFASGVPDIYQEVLRSVESGHALPDAERERIGVDHAVLGAQLLQDWGLPGLLIDAVKNQLEPRRAAEKSQPLAQAILQARQMIPYLLERHRAGLESDPDAVSAQPPSPVELDANAVTAILEEFKQTAELFEVELNNPTSALDLLAQAHDEATRVGIMADVESARTASQNEELFRRATTDALTGTANRPAFHERLELALRGLSRKHGHFAVLLMDIDRFKQVNDRYGHLVGDEVLRRLADALRGALRDVDMLARYGGDEFVILAPQVEAPGAKTIAERVSACVRNVRIEARGELVPITASIGVSVTGDYAQIPKPNELLADADKQLYVAKRSGRDTWAYADRSASGSGRAASALSMHGT